MHSKRLRVEQPDASLSNTRTPELRAYLDRLIDNLDDSSLRAVLKLMISESRGAVRRQRQLIALARLVGREAAGQMDRLRELEAAQKQLTALYASHAESEDEGTDDQGMDEGAPPPWRVEGPLQGASTRTATPSSVHAFKGLGTNRKEPGDYGGRLSAAALKGELARADRRPSAIDKVGTALVLPADAVLYRQGEAADNLYYLESGAMAIGATSPDGEQAVVAVHGPGIFFGARSLGHEIHNATATALLQSAIVRVSKAAVQDLLRTDPMFARQFAINMMRRAARLEEDQVDRVVNSTEKRLARALLILASLDADSDAPRVLEHMTEARLASMLAADPGCIGALMEKFRQAGHLGPGEPLTVHSSLAMVLLPGHFAAGPNPFDVRSQLR